MPDTALADAQAPEAEALPAPVPPDPEPPRTATPAESFLAWWAATVPNSPLSRDTARYNRLFDLRSQFLTALSSVTGG